MQISSFKNIKTEKSEGEKKKREREIARRGKNKSRRTDAKFSPGRVGGISSSIVSASAFKEDASCMRVSKSASSAGVA